MTPKPEPSAAWVWDKFKAYEEGNDLVHGRMLRMIAQCEHDNQALKMEINSLQSQINQLIAREGMY
jgi:hypothetical protein